MNWKKVKKNLSLTLSSETNFNEYTKCKKDLELIYKNIAESIKIRSKCQWYEEAEK